MHLLVLVQPQFPEFEKPGVVDEFVKYLSSQVFQVPGKALHPNWTRIRPREIHLFDFQIPEDLEKEVVAMLLPYEGPHRLSTFINDLTQGTLKKYFMKVIFKKFGILPVEKKGITPIKLEKNYPVYVAILGKLEDKKIENLEML